MKRLKMKEGEGKEEEERREKKRIEIDLGEQEGKLSQVVYLPRFIGYDVGWEWVEYLDKHIPWTRPTIRVFGRSCLQPRDTCYIATPGVPQLEYSGYKPRAYSWDDFPRLKELLSLVHQALPGARFNSLLLNRYRGGADYVGWHSDDEKLYGPAPEIASLSLGCSRDFLLKPRPRPNSKGKSNTDTESQQNEPEPATATASKRLKRTGSSAKRLNSSCSYTTNADGERCYCFTLDHGSLLLMAGYTQRDWLHSVPKRAAKAKADALRINLTFRLVLSPQPNLI